MSKKFKYIPKDKRKKILLICDDIRVHSGVAKPFAADGYDTS